MPEHHTGIMGGTMRLGKKTTMFKVREDRQKSILCKYKNAFIKLFYSSLH